MIGLDTNVLLRAITGDDPVQTPIARGIFATLSETNPGFINLVVLAEFAWTLDRRYGYQRSEICNVMRHLLESSYIVLAGRTAVERALTLADEDGLDYPDALICELNRSARCTTTMTFDRKASRSQAFSLAR